MKHQPAFVVVAGPNGAGKSFYSSHKDDTLIRDFGINSFDFDLAFSNLYRKFESIMSFELEQNLANKVKEIFEQDIDHSLKSRLILTNHIQISGGLNFNQRVIKLSCIFYTSIPYPLVKTGFPRGFRKGDILWTKKQ